MWTNDLMCVKTHRRYSIRKEMLMVFYVQMIGRRSVMCRSYVGGTQRLKSNVWNEGFVGEGKPYSVYKRQGEGVLSLEDLSSGFLAKEFRGKFS